MGRCLLNDYQIFPWLHSLVPYQRELSGLSLTEIAETFKMSSYKSVGTACFRLKKKMEENKTIKKKYKRLKFLCRQGKKY